MFEKLSLPKVLRTEMMKIVVLGVCLVVSLCEFWTYLQMFTEESFFRVSRLREEKLIW